MKLSVQGLNSYYGPAHILFDVALEVGEGEVGGGLADLRSFGGLGGRLLRDRQRRQDQRSGVRLGC